MKNNAYALVILVLTLVGCQALEKQRNEIMVTIAPQKYFVEAIAGKQFNVITMIPPKMSPATYNPTPSQIVKLNNCKAYLSLGSIGFEKRWISKLKSNASKTEFYRLDEDIQYATNELQKHTDPHIWTSSHNAKIISNNIYEILIKLDEKHQKYYKKNLDSITNVIKGTETKVKEILKNSKNKSFLIYHPILTYFAKENDLCQIIIEKEGKEPSPQYLNRIIELSKRKKAKVTFIQKEFDIKNAQIIAEETNSDIIEINPLSYYWDKEIIRIAKAIRYGKNYRNSRTKL